MTTKGKKTTANEVRPRLRVISGPDIALGPGKVELLELLESTGSIVEAARRMDMSYMRAWTLIRTMNQCFREPVIHAVRGGRKGGGAQLTETGREALRLYHRMNAQCLRAARPEWRRLEALLRDHA
jgi:molybdate transport system regulatory protein